MRGPRVLTPRIRTKSSRTSLELTYVRPSGAAGRHLEGCRVHGRDSGFAAKASRRIVGSPLSAGICPVGTLGCNRFWAVPLGSTSRTAQCWLSRGSPNYLV